jgi:hypothetical protein
MARWEWWPAGEGAEDELSFPKGAEITEVSVENDDWYSGAYMGAHGLVPSKRVRIG